MWNAAATTSMTPLDAYRTYLGLRQHFTSPSYDYIQYGPTKAKETTFSARKDRWLFHKLSKRPDVEGWLVANFVDRPKAPWLGDLLGDPESDRIALEWQGRCGARRYHLSKQLTDINFTIPDDILVLDGNHPRLLQCLLTGSITMDTLVILEYFLQFRQYWDRKINDPVIWPEVSAKLLKTKGFVKFSPDQLRGFLAENGWIYPEDAS